ncbi:MAG: hypothetical protein EOP84_08530 [Verrucomicrobiaceae bacterium]|nr:MAG: hypothetical protein EOP84_08530 [Verrucomicrobiaceae bacterium]
MLRFFAAFLVGVFVALSVVSVRNFIKSYVEAEPLHPVVTEFAQTLVEQIGRQNRREMQWSDLTTLLREERFARLRGLGFIPSIHPEVLMTVRINDMYDFPIHRDGTVTWMKRNGT